MAKGKVIRDDLHRAVKVEKYLFADQSDPLVKFTVEYVGDTGTPALIKLGSYATITRNEDGAYTYSDNIQESRIVTDVTIHHLRGAVSWTDPYVKRWLLDEYQEVSLDDKPTGNDQGYAAFLIVILVVFLPLIGVPMLIGWAAEQRIASIRRKRRQLMERAYNAFYKIKS